jgi:hypothetical protein
LVKHNFFAITIIYRGVLGVCLSQLNEIEEATIFNFFIGLLFTIYIIGDRPYIKAYHNWRSLIVQIGCLSGLFVTMFYRSMRSTTSITTYTSNLGPAMLVLIMLIFNVGVSLTVVSYEFYEGVIKKICLYRSKQISEK